MGRFESGMGLQLLLYQCKCLGAHRVLKQSAIRQVLYSSHVVIWIRLTWLRRASSVTLEGCYDFYEEAIRLQKLIVKACPFKHLAEQYIIYVNVCIV